MNHNFSLTKRWLLVMVLGLACGSTAWAQYYREDAATAQTPDFRPPAPTVFIDISAGIDNPVGLIGAQLEGLVAPSFTLRGGVGLGSWGYKLNGGVRYYLRNEYPYGWALGSSLSYATGIPGLEIELEDVGGVSRPFVIDCEPIPVLNLTIARALVLGKRGRLTLETGYSLRFDNGNNYVVRSGGTLSRESHDILTILQPGGLILSMQFSFALQ